LDRFVSLCNRVKFETLKGYQPQLDLFVPFVAVVSFAMKPSKINVSILCGVFLSVGLIADLLPHPGLSPGVVSRAVDWVLADHPLPLAQQAPMTGVGSAAMSPPWVATKPNHIEP
jgi:hypothetical protein